MNLSSFFIVQSGLYFMVWRPNTPKGICPWEFVSMGKGGFNIHVFESREAAQAAINEVAHKFAKSAIIHECQGISQTAIL